MQQRHCPNLSKLLLPFPLIIGLTLFVGASVSATEKQHASAVTASKPQHPIDAPTSQPAIAAGHANVIELDNQIISPVTQKYIQDAIDRSESDGAVCLIVMLDTPGGLLESTRAIVKHIMNAKVPVVVYVAPSGSRAGSAGVFITLAAHVAAMAPSTNIGAAHPVVVGAGGGPMRKLIRRIKHATAPASKRNARETEEEVVEEEQQDPMTQKIVNDTVAWITTIAKARGHNEAWAAKAVTESFSVTETDALQKHIVDVLATDLADLLVKIDGRQVRVTGVPIELHTAHATIVRVPMSKRQEFLATIANPNIAYLLMLLGTLGLIVEFTHPGLSFPGIAGVICLLLALYAFQTLPVSYAALGLMAVGLGLLIAEIKVVSHGLLAMSGVIALTLGSLMLFESSDPNIRVSLHVIIPAVATLAAIILFVVQRALRAQTHPVTTGVQGLLGEVGVASTDLNLEGKVFIHGELWNASSPRRIQQGEKVRVIRVEGLHLLVEPHPLSCESKKGGGTRNPAPMQATSRPPAEQAPPTGPAPMLRFAPRNRTAISGVESRKCFAFHGTKQRVGGGPMAGSIKCRCISNRR